MKIILLGNAGAGKTTLSRQLLAAHHPAASLSLDRVAFGHGSKRFSVAESVRQALTFIDSHPSWVIEGCYADIIEPLLGRCEKLIFLNPGVETCIANCMKRPWEPGKFESKAAQDRHLPNLLDWVASYETREDEYGLIRHRALFDSFRGPKEEVIEPRPEG